jgi:hypothetical protein
MGLAIQSNNISVYKAYIKDIKSFNNLTLPFLFSNVNKFNLRLVLNDLSILTKVKEIMIIFIYLFIGYIYAVSNISILVIFTSLAKIY